MCFPPPYEVGTLHGGAPHLLWRGRAYLVGSKEMQTPPYEVGALHGGASHGRHIKYTLKRINLVWKPYLDLLCLIHIVLRTICKKGKAYRPPKEVSRLRNLKFVSIFVYIF